MTVVWNDTMAYFCGITFGHKYSILMGFSLDSSNGRSPHCRLIRAGKDSLVEVSSQSSSARSWLTSSRFHISIVLSIIQIVLSPPIISRSHTPFHRYLHQFLDLTQSKSNQFSFMSSSLLCLRRWWHLLEDFSLQLSSEHME